MFSLRQILEHRYKYQQSTVACFIDFKAAFDCVDRECLWKILRVDGVPHKLVNVIRAYYAATEGRIRSQGQVSRSVKLTSGVKQGCVLSPMLFNWAIDWILKRALEGYRGVQISDDTWVTDLDYADDVVIFGEDSSSLQPVITRVSEVAASIGLRINVDKTKLFSMGTPNAPRICIDGCQVEGVNSFKYLGASFLPTGQVVDEIKTRINKARTVFVQLSKVVFRRREISLRTKVRVYQASVRAVLLYGCETWQVRAEDLQKISVFDNWCLRSLARIRLSDRVSNEELRSRCSSINSIAQLLQMRRLRWFGHVLRRGDGEITYQTLTAKPCRVWKARRGGQYKTWIATVKSDVDKLDLVTVYGICRWNRDWIQLCEDMAADRTAWKATINTILRVCDIGVRVLD